MFNALFPTIPSQAEYERDTVDILRLIRSENVGPKTFIELIKLFGNASSALENIQEFSMRGGRPKPIKICTEKDAYLEIKKLNAIGAKLITFKSSKYSQLLLNIHDFPPILTYKGNIELLINSRAIAIVGARNASVNGKFIASKFAKELVNVGYTVVSGLARGIDAAAHHGITNKAIAVIAGGIDHVYPPENIKLYEQISKEGLLLAELPVGSKPLPQHFPQRNRLISGLSLGVIVIEASLKSGTLITARFALEQNREVFAVPGFPLDPRNHGTNKLIKEGAYLVESAEDIIDNISDFTNLKAQMRENSANDSFQPLVPNKYVDEVNNSMRKKVLGLLSASPIDFSDLVKETEFPLPIIYTIVIEFELAGKISRLPGNKIALKYTT